MSRFNSEELNKLDAAVNTLITQRRSMLALLEKALPIIENEAELREASMHRHGEDKCVTTYWTEMRELANEIQAEIDKAYGREVKTDAD